MDKKKLLSMIKAKRPDLLAGKDMEKITDAEVEALARMAQETRGSEDLSLDRIRDLLWEAIRDRFKPANDNAPYASLREVFPGYLIYEFDAKLYRLAWSILDGEVKLGDNPVEVEQQWVETRSAQAESDEGVELLMRLGAAKNPEGSAWDVTICEPGFTKNGWFIPDEALRAAADGKLFENVDVNLYELPQGASHLPDSLFDLKTLLVKNKVGWIDGVKHAAGVGLQGVLHFLDTAKWLGQNLMAAMKDGKAVYGLSYDCPVRAKKDVVDGKQVFKVLKFVAADSVDIVTRPAAGGKFNRAVASLPAQNKEDTMKQSLWDLIQKVRPDLLKGKVFDTATDQEVEALAKMAMEPATGGDPPDPATLATKLELETLRCGMSLDRSLAASELPEIAQARIRTTYSGKVFKDEDLARAIADEKDYLAKINTPADPAPVSISGIHVGLGTFERACMAADRLFGLTAVNLTDLAGLRRLDNQPFFADVRSAQDIGDYDKIPSFSSLREMYAFFTGDPEVSGRFNRKALPAELRSRMDVTSATFTYVLGNTLGRRLVSAYREFQYREDLLISIRKPVKDFRTQEAVLVGGFSDLADVDPEAADYAEIGGVTDEESTYVLGQKGNILTITRKTIINDDISIVQRLLTALARATRRTHAKYVWGKFISNVNCSDGTAWFTGGHGNLGATALSHATALIAYLALANMTEKDSAEPIGLLDDPGVKPALVGSMTLMPTIEQIANEEHYFSANDLTTKIPNPLHKKVIPVPFSLLTDVNDWGMIMPPNVADCVEMGYLNGRQEPEMFVADSPQSEQVFMADKIRHKVRHEYAGAVINFRSGYKAVVA
ncbi:MAG: hypothetical protein KKD99_13615 [Proteobacteria bacterium]|nr:hypothetical protein [Pseudomonadota bacterium]